MLFPLFVIVTLLEIYVLVSVGESIGGFSTVMLVVITALIGSTLLKQQGWSTMAKAQQAMANGQTPAFEMLEGVVILISGVLLLTPGFITDTVGLLGLMLGQELILLTKYLQKMLQRYFLKITLFLSTKRNQIAIRNKTKKTPLKVNFGKISKP